MVNNIFLRVYWGLVSINATRAIYEQKYMRQDYFRQPAGYYPSSSYNFLTVSIVNFVFFTISLLAHKWQERTACILDGIAKLLTITQNINVILPALLLYTAYPPNWLTVPNAKFFLQLKKFFYIKKFFQSNFLHPSPPCGGTRWE
jgi:hypothetical protein